MDSVDNKIWGIYRHFKGNHYNVYCLAIDKWGNRFVLYQQLYGDNSFWLRPYNMFFSKTEVDGKLIDRFAPTPAKRKDARTQIHNLISLINNQTLTAKNSENEQVYCFTNISIEHNYVCVHPINESQSSGYLTEYELASRMGYDLLVINNKIQITKKKTKISDPFQLLLGKNNISTLEQQLNPCSIDLQIAESGFLCAKKASVDPQSIEHISNATSLWKEVRLHPSKNQQNNYFKLRPKQTILTHTKERIKIPEDCAGKIEIKSTYARLSLSITSGDFCNPGYDGFFPMEITNFGKHTVIIHANETMAQLMLVPLSGPILVDYSQKATYKNASGYDDGTPYTFWRERSVKALRKESGSQPLIDLYDRVLANIKPENTSDIPGFRERFTDSFLTFCQRRMYKHKFKRGGLPDLHKLVHTYINHEKNIKKICSFKWISAVGSVLSIVLSFILNSVQNIDDPSMLLAFFTSNKFIWGLGIIAILLLFLAIFLFIKTPKTFCTFEEYDIDADIDAIKKSTL